MTTSMTRWFSPLLVCLVLAGCSLPMLNLTTTEEAELFAQGLDQYIESGELVTLKLLSQQYPQGEWRTRAETIIDTSEQQRLLQAQQEKIDKELVQCQHEKEFLVKDNQILELTLERLKQVLIDMELRAE